MSRPPLPIGGHGKITRRQLPDGRWAASCRARDTDGVTRQVRVIRGTGRKDDNGKAAEDALLEHLTHRAGTSRTVLRADTSVRSLADSWLDSLKVDSKITEQSRATYRRTVDGHVLPALGAVRLNEVQPGDVDDLLQAIHRKAPATARLARVVLAGMFNYAVRRGALDLSPVRSLERISKPKKAPRALTLNEVVQLREGVRRWQTTPHKGPRRGEDLLDIVDVMLGTGCRIGEVLALRWSDVDLAAKDPTMTVAGTLVQLPGKGVIRQDHPKTGSSHRKAVLPKFAAAAILRRRVEGVPSKHDVIFPAANGELRSPNNVRRQWRSAREAAGFDWVTPHTFRRTVATLLKDKVDLETASEVLGHADSRVTKASYVDGAQSVPDVSKVLETLGTASESGE